MINRENDISFFAIYNKRGFFLPIIDFKNFVVHRIWLLIFYFIFKHDSCENGPFRLEIYVITEAIPFTSLYKRPSLCYVDNNLEESKKKTLENVSRFVL